jgi:hypothetical protein
LIGGKEQRMEKQKTADEISTGGFCYNLREKTLNIGHKGIGIQQKYLITTAHAFASINQISYAICDSTTMQIFRLYSHNSSSNYA